MPDSNENLPSGFVLQGTTPEPSSPVEPSLPSGFVLENSSSPTPPTTQPSPENLPSGFVLQGNPDNGQTPATPTQHLYQDSSQPLYKRAWDWANTPLTESLFGLPEERAGAGGFERGVEHIVSGLTSPLSVALTAATFGTGGLIESAGASALREAGLSAAEITEATKGSQIAASVLKNTPSIEPVIESAIKAKGGDELWNLVNDAKKVLGPVDKSADFAEPEVQKTLSEAGFDEAKLEQLSGASKEIQKATQNFSPVEDAVRGAGVDPSLWKKTQDTLANVGLSEADLLGGNALERGAFHILRSVDKTLPIASAVRAAKTANTILNAGFTYQQLESAAAMSPRFLDALKEGDTDHAWEYGTEALAGTVLGVAGMSHALHSAGELFKPLLENDKFRPNDEWLAIDRANKDREATHSVAEQYGIDIHKKANGLAGIKSARPVLGDTPEVAAEKQGKKDIIDFGVQTGMDAGKAGSLHDILAEAAGKDERVSPNTEKILSSEHTSNGVVYRVTPIEQEGNLRIEATRSDGTKIGAVDLLHETGTKGYFTSGVSVPEQFRKQGVATELYRQLPEIAKRYGISRITGEGAQTEGGKGIWNALAREGLAKPVDMSEYGESPRLGMEFGENPSRPDNGQPRSDNWLPTNLPDQIATNNFKNQTPEYQNRILSALKTIATDKVPDNLKSAIDYLRKEDARTYEIGQGNGVLRTKIEDHLHRRYKDDPDSKVIAAQDKAGQFDTNVTAARQRVYNSLVTALLKSPKEMLIDPADAVAQDRVSVIKAAANKQLIDTLRDKFTRGSDGRPAVVLGGGGTVVSGDKGVDPKTFIDPNRLRKVNIANPVVQQLTKSGDLQRFLDDGTIRDITPRIYPDSVNVVDQVKSAIERLEEQATKQSAKYDEVGNNKLRTDLMYLKSMLNNNDFSGLKEFNESQPKQYAWDPQDYISLAHNAMKGWNFVVHDPRVGQVAVKSDIRVHPEFAEYLKNRLGLEKSGLASNPIGAALLEAGSKLKKLLLDFSPFHLVQEALRGVLVGVNPISALKDAWTGEHPNVLNGDRVNPEDPNSPTKQYVGVANGLTTGTDYKAQQEHSEGVASGGDELLRKIPGVGNVIANSMQWYQDFLFKRYIPSLKARGYELMFDRYRDAHPDWTVDHVARAAATHTNNTFGGINWKAMGRSATTQDWARLVTLAPDWLEAEMRSGANLFNKDEGGLGRAQVIKMSLAMWGIARVLNLVTTGSPHIETPFGLAVKNKEGKETVFSIRTLPQDLLHAASDPVQFVTGRLSPTARMGEELISQRDSYGRKLQPQDLWADVFRNMMPIPGQAIGQAVSGTGPEVGNVGQAWKAVGGTAQTYSTPAQKLAATLAASHSEDGYVDPSQQARHRQILRLEDQARAGEISWPDLMKLTYNTDDLRESELKKIETNLKATHDLPADVASLYMRASRLPAKEFLDLWDVSNPSEKAALVPLMKQTQKRYLSTRSNPKSNNYETPQDRAKDPVFQRMLNMIPQTPTQQ